MTRYHLVFAVIIICCLGCKFWQDNDWDAYAKSHGCKSVEERQGNHWASIGLNGHPRVGMSADKEKFVCADGKVFWRDKL